MMESALRVATWTAAVLLAAGLAVWLAGAPAAGFILHAGIILLMATPVVRVVMALVEYLRERDWLFAALTAVVLACVALPAARYVLSSLR